MSFLRSLLFSTPLIALSTIVMGMVSLIVSLFDSTGELQHNVARAWARSLLAVSFMRVRVEGLDQLSTGGHYVFACNHGSYMDIPALLAVLPWQFRFFAKKGLYSIPFLGWYLNRAGHFPVDRSNARNSLKSMSEGARLVAERGVSVLLFPEGGRNPVGLRAFKEGAAYIAIKAGVPIVPMAIVGMRPLLPQGSIHLRSGNVVVQIGEPIPTAGMKSSNREALTAEIYGAIAHMLDESGGSDRLAALAPEHPSPGGVQERPAESGYGQRRRE
jgi:1-acyl-sn-glycerol-3-phosphate acyltransferase